MKWSLPVALAASVLVPRAAHAYRPFDGTDADVAETGEIEIELGPVQAVHSRGSNTYTPGLVFNQGFADGYELVVDIDGLVPLGTSPGNTLLVSDFLVKHVIREGSLQDGKGPSIAIETGVLLPDVLPHGDEAGWTFAVIASQRWSEITVHVNAQVEYGRDRQATAIGSVIIEGPSTRRVRPVAELLAEQDTDHGGEVSALGGAIWQARKNLAFDAAARIDRDTGVTEVEVRAGLTWAFED